MGIPGMNDEFWDLVDRLVPDYGPADTEQGELVRAVLRLTAEFYRNGCGNWDDYFEAMAQFAWDKFSDGSLDVSLAEEVRSLLDRLRSYGRRFDEPRDAEYRELIPALEKPLENAAAQWCQRHPEPIPFVAGPEFGGACGVARQSDAPDTTTESSGANPPKSSSAD
jgi:hypothetical protein